MAKVSIVIPLYNGARYIAETIRSVLEQSFKDFELLVVDDGSTDDGPDIVRSFSLPVILLHQENTGTAAARNFGFSRATGKYIAFLDQDDQWDSEKLAFEVAALDAHPEIAVVYSDVDLIDETGRVLAPERSVTCGSFLRGFPDYPQPHPFPSTVLMRRETFERAGMFDPEFRKNCHEDTELWFRILKKELGQFHCCSKALVRRRLHAAQGGRNQDSWDENWILCLDKLIQLFDDEPATVRRLSRVKARTYSHRGRELVRTGNRAQGLAEFKKSFFADPLYLPNLRRLAAFYLSLR